MGDVIRELEHLEKLAREDPTKRFDRLYRLLRQETFLVLARQRALFIYKPGKLPSPETRYFVWHKTPQRLTLTSATVKTVRDRRICIDTGWAGGYSQHKRLETRFTAHDSCQCCGATEVPLFVHHPNRLDKAKRGRKGASHVARSGIEQQTKLLCRTCHLAHHHGNTRQ
jgi:hypothetical protein